MISMLPYGIESFFQRNLKKFSYDSTNQLVRIRNLDH